ncbi:NTP transferase domain-containing protein [Curtobacterium luteum]|uniref:nucleotidyltransferase family protein n=1 Tax=Curtobacterium luteum TaxID=33881 RepID=UPI0037F29BDC
MTRPAPGVTGLVLAAGRGSRMGRPKALVTDASGEPWTAVAAGALLAGGCAEVVVVLGASAPEASGLLGPRASVTLVTAPDWAAGLSASLRAGLEALAERPATEAVLVTTVDTPDLPVAAVERVLDVAGPLAGVLRRAVHDGRPGHPVLIGRGHWSALGASLAGDEGAGRYLREHGAEPVECGDLWDGHDQDVPGPVASS